MGVALYILAQVMRESPVAAALGVVVAGAAAVWLAVVLTAEARRYNAEQYPAARAAWERTALCEKCGGTFPLPAPAVA